MQTAIESKLCANPALSQYLRMIADILGLRDWTFYISDAPAPFGCDAEVTPCYGRKHAQIRLSERFWALPPEAQRSALIHELLECKCAPARLIARNEISNGALFGFEMEIEYFIDGVADAIAPFFPLPR